MSDLPPQCRLLSADTSSFGAVLEEFEVCDALSGILAEKDSQTTPALDQKTAAQHISVH